MFDTDFEWRLTSPDLHPSPAELQFLSPIKLDSSFRNSNGFELLMDALRKPSGNALIEELRNPSGQTNTSVNSSIRVNNSFCNTSSSTSVNTRSTSVNTTSSTSVNTNTNNSTSSNSIRSTVINNTSSVCHTRIAQKSDNQASLLGSNTNILPTTFFFSEDRVSKSSVLHSNTQKICPVSFSLFKPPLPTDQFVENIRICQEAGTGFILIDQPGTLSLGFGVVFHVHYLFLRKRDSVKTNSRITCFFVFQNTSISQIHEVYNFTNFCLSVFPGKVSTNSSMSKNMNITYDSCTVSVSNYINMSKDKPHQFSNFFQNAKLWEQVIYISSKIPKVHTYFTAHARYKQKCEILNLSAQQQKSTMVDLPGFLYIYDFCIREGSTLSSRSVYDLTFENQQNTLQSQPMLQQHPVLQQTLQQTLQQPTQQPTQQTLQQPTQQPTQQTPQQPTQQPSKPAKPAKPTKPTKPAKPSDAIHKKQFEKHCMIVKKLTKRTDTLEQIIKSMKETIRKQAENNKTNYQNLSKWVLGKHARQQNDCDDDCDDDSDYTNDSEDNDLKSQSD